VKKVAKSFFHRLKKHDHGVSLIEFAIVIPLLLVLVMGIIEFGWVYNGYITLHGATREGARMASIYRLLPGDEDYTGYIETEVKKHATNTLQIENVRVIPFEMGANPNRTKGIRVEADGKISLLLGIPLIPLDNPFEFSAQTTMRLE
jgi:hypothetical protein